MPKAFAVLVDAENIPARHWQTIREQLVPQGTILSCRIFGDFADGRCGKWLKIAREESLQTCMQLSGPNASDIAITIAAMDLLQTGRFDAVALVSSDSDLTPLAQRLRNGGIHVVGFGEMKTPHTLRKACTRFVELKPKAKPAPVARAVAA